MEEKEKLLKVWLVLGALLYPSWSLLITYAFPNENDLFYQRLLLSGIYILSLILERKVDFIKKHFESIAYFLVFFMLTHYYYLAYLSGYSLLYQLGTFIVTGTTSFVFLRRKVAIFNTFYSLFILLVVAYLTNLESKILLILAPGILTIQIVAFVILHVTISLSDELIKQRIEMTNSSRLASLGEMAGGIAHEINNPLAIIHGYIAKMKRMKKKELLNDEEFYRITEQILNVVDRIVVIIKSLRKFARNDGNSQFEQKNMTEIVEEVIQLTSKKLKLLSIKVEHNIPEWDPIIECREVQISQVLFNLFSNSIDAIENLEEKWINISYEKDDEKITMSFTDSGTGIDKDISEKILEPFFTTKAVGKGTGLGLSISHSIMQEHKGNIELDSSSQNTKFKLYFCQKYKEHKFE